MNKAKSIEKKKWESLKNDFEMKKNRLDKGWIKRGEIFTDPSSGSEKRLTPDNVQQAIRYCDGHLVKYSEVQHKIPRTAIIALNISVLLIIGVALGFVGWKYLGTSGVTGFVVAEVEKVAEQSLAAVKDIAKPEATPTPEPSLLTQPSLKQPSDIPQIPMQEEKTIRTDNHPPAFSGLESLDVQGEIVIDMGEYVKDEDHDALTFIATQPEGTVVAVKNNKVRIVSQKEGRGVITFYASDDTARSSKEVPITFKPAP